MKLARCVLPALALFALSPAASADRFYFGSEEAEAKMTEGSADYIEGVLLKEEGGFYVIRVEGGEMRVPKASVRKIERDEMTVEAVEKREGDAREFLAEANSLRSSMLAADAASYIERVQQVRAAEATARREAAAVEASVPPILGSGYDPILHVSYPAGADTQLIRNELGGLIRREMQKDTRREMRRR